MKRILAATAALTALLAASAHAAEPKLEARAILPADASFPAPFNGVVNTDPVLAPGSSQPVGGFSALLDAGNGDFYAMPDNGFGRTANSRSFILPPSAATPAAVGPTPRRQRQGRHLDQPDPPGGLRARQSV